MRNDASAQPVLVADIGGTWARFALADWDDGGKPTLHDEQQLAVVEHASLIAAAQHYLSLRPGNGAAPQAAAFAVAGRVEGDVAMMTNHPWRIVASETTAALGIAQVALLNDFTAQALAVQQLREQDRCQIGGDAATDMHGDLTFPVLGPGTGLGVSALLRRGGQTFALASEGGHAAFAPKTAQQRAVLECLSSRYPRVSYERLLSGNGLSNLHWALRCIGGDTAPAELEPAEVTARARQGDATATEAVRLFCEVFGAFAGDLVLTFGGWDGVFLSGGLVPRLLEELQSGDFRAAFENKGRFSAAMRRVPVYAVLHAQPGLLGAAAALASSKN